MSSKRKILKIPDLHRSWIILVWFTAAIPAWQFIWTKSPMLDEPGHLASGLAHWTTGDMRHYRVNPPGFRLLATLPLALTGHTASYVKLPASASYRTEFALGRDYFRQHGLAAQSDLQVARMANLGMLAVGILATYWVARHVHRRRDAKWVAALWAGCPLLLGWFGSLTPDAAAASMIMMAIAGYLHWWRRRTFAAVVVAGIAAGGLLGVKTTGILLLPVLGLHAMAFRPRRGFAGSHRSDSAFAQARGARLCDSVLQVGVGFAVLLLTINAIYLFQGERERLYEMQFQSRLGRKVQSLVAFRPLAACSMALPANFFYGIDTQQTDFEEGKPSYLNGEIRDYGYYTYYLFALAIKTPEPMIVLVAIAAWMTWKSLIVRTGSRGRHAGILCAMAVVAMLVAISVKNGFSAHPRYAILAVPPTFILVGYAFRLPGSWVWVPRSLVIASIAVTLFHCRHPVSFSNLVSGGPRRGHEWLLDSATDWGEDLLLLDEFRLKHVADGEFRYSVVSPLPRDFFIHGGATLGHRGRDEQDSGTLSPGVYAISVNHLHGYPRSSPKCQALLARDPDAWIGNTICVYELREPLPYSQIQFPHTASIGP